jgi:nickel-dependent lactate racemase
MDVLQLQLPYGTSFVDVRLPHIPFDIVDCPAAGPPLQRAELERALDHPIASPPLETLARGRRTAVILISDASRLCPSAAFLELLVDRLNRAGIADERIRIIVALGMHRRQTTDELIRLAGRSVYERVQVLNHSALPDDCIRLGVTTRGTPVEINRLVVEADLRIATGNIEPHRLVGMSGGVKALVPGVASSRCIEIHHSLSARWQAEPGSTDNELHRDLAEAAAFMPIHFLFNVVVNPKREILRAFCGDVRAAHQAGIAYARELFQVPVSKRYDAVVVSPGGHPKDMQLYQTVKTLQNAAQITKPGGRILCAARCEELYGNGVLQTWIETIGDGATMLERLAERFVLGAHKVKPIQELISRYRVQLYSAMPPSVVRLVGFEPIENWNAQMEQLDRERGIAVAVMPHGAVTFPIASEISAKEMKKK